MHVYIYLHIILYAAALKYPSAQFQTSLEQYQVIELIVSLLQQYRAVLKIQVS